MSLCPYNYLVVLRNARIIPKTSNSFFFLISIRICHSWIEKYFNKNQFQINGGNYVLTSEMELQKKKLLIFYTNKNFLFRYTIVQIEINNNMKEYNQTMNNGIQILQTRYFHIIT